MGTLLFILFFVFIVVPIVRVVLTIYRARRQTRQFFDRFRNAASGGTEQQRRSEAPRKPTPKKKIDPSVGEYVAFEEIKSTVSESGAGKSATYTEVEQQVEDVEWEDIK